MTTTPPAEVMPAAAAHAAYRWKWTPGEGFYAGGRIDSYWVPEQEPPAWGWLGHPPRSGRS